MDEGWTDYSVLEAASWRLISELHRRHPTTTEVHRTHPGDGMYDCLSLFHRDHHGPLIDLNRVGRIHVHGRLDGRPVEWEPATWDHYLRADPRDFVSRLEAAAGLPAPRSVPASTPSTLIHRILAAIVATAIKSVAPIEVRPGVLNSSAWDDGPTAELVAFPGIPPHLLETRDPGVKPPGARFWVVTRNGEPMLAFERDAGLAWARNTSAGIAVMAMYEEYRRNLQFTTAKLMRMADGF